MGGGSDTCRVVLEELRGVMVWLMVRYVYDDILKERFVSSCSVIEFFNIELNQLKQRNEME